MLDDSDLTRQVSLSDRKRRRGVGWARVEETPLCVVNSVLQNYLKHAVKIIRLERQQKLLREYGVSVGEVFHAFFPS